MSTRDRHAPVLLEEALTGLAVRASGLYVDGTFGRGGHTREILRNLGPSGRVFAIDKDPAACECANRLAGNDSRLMVRQGSFLEIEALAKQHGVFGEVDGVLFDLGVSSPQLDDAARGFSFRQDGPLDMRMDPGTGLSARDWLETQSEGGLARILRDYGEERFAGRIARNIISEVRSGGLHTTGQLAELISRSVPRREHRIHPATRSFLALRMAVNRELDDLAMGLEHAVEVLAPHGRLVVISFHSIEDRIVKRFMRALAKPPAISRKLPLLDTFTPVLALIGRALKPSMEEVNRNPRARSAILRIAEKVAA